MGRSTTPTYRLIIHCQSGRHYTPMGWNCRQDGKPTVANLDKWVRSFEQSCIDGANKHLGLDPVCEARIERNVLGGSTICSWRRRDHRPLFEAI